MDPEDYKDVWREAEEALHRLAADYEVTLEQLLDEEGEINTNISLDQPQIRLR